MIDNPLEETIFAPITAVGSGGAVCVLRISGKKAIHALQPYVDRVLTEIKSQHTLLTKIQTPKGELIDEVLLTLYRAPRSYTGEDVIELSCHNSSYIIHRLGQLLYTLGMRAAYPGEFSRRAVIQGKMTLAQAEATADLIEAKTEFQHHLALQQMKSGFSKKLRQLREALIKFAALIELELDFSEEDVTFAQRDSLLATILETQREVSQLLDSFALGRAIKEGIPIAIVGKPNAGKSTLLNTLLEEERAMVSEIAGTTRDFIEETFTLGGMAYRLIDTAGLRSSNDPLESEGIHRTWQKVASAALILHLFDATATSQIELQEERETLQRKAQENARIYSIANKIDRLEKSPAWLLQASHCQISAQSGQHIDKLKEMIVQDSGLESLPQTILLTNQRHHHHLYQAQQHLQQIEAGLRSDVSSEFIAIDLKAAAQELGNITGEITHQDVLDHIFSKFCIGK